jgi:hypothetical protein
MTVRWTWTTLLAATLALTACDKGKAPPAEAPGEPAPTATPTAAPEPQPEPPAPAPEADDPQPGQAPGSPAPTADAGARADEPEPPGGDGDGKSGGDGKGAGKGKKPPVGTAGKCGGVGGIRCKKGQKCYHDSKPPPPDAMGRCVPEKYCQEPPDCEGLMHIMVVGRWECVKNVCAWKAEGGASAPQ